MTSNWLTLDFNHPNEPILYLSCVLPSPHAYKSLNSHSLSPKLTFTTWLHLKPSQLSYSSLTGTRAIGSSMLPSSMLHIHSSPPSIVVNVAPNAPHLPVPQILNVILLQYKLLTWPRQVIQLDFAPKLSLIMLLVPWMHLSSWLLHMSSPPLVVVNTILNTPCPAIPRMLHVILLWISSHRTAIPRILHVILLLSCSNTTLVLLSSIASCNFF